MALGDLLGGLAQGLGAAATGRLQGQIKGEAEVYRRQQAALDKEYKKLALAAKKKELDPDKDLIEYARQQALQNQGVMTNPANREYFLTPEGAKHFKRLQDQNHVWLGVLNRTVSPRDLDRYMLANAPEPEDGMGEPGSPLGKLPFLREPGTAMAPPLGALGGREPMADQWSGGANIPLDAPPGPALAPRQGPPDIGPAPAPPAKPPTPLETYNFLKAHPPVVQPNPGELPQRTLARQRQAEALWRTQLEDAYRAVFLEDKQREGAARAGIAQSDLGVRPELNRQRVVGGVAKIEGTRAQTALTRATTPGKVRKTEAEAKVAEQKPKLIEREQNRKDRAQQETERHNRAVEGLGAWRNRIAAAAQKDTATYRKATIARMKFVTDHFDELQVRQDRRAKINALSRIATAQQSIGQLKGSAAAVQGKDALDELNGIFDAIEKEAKGVQKAKPQVSSVSTTAVLGKKPAGEGRKTFAGKSYTFSEFMAEGKRRKKRPEDLKAKWAEL